MIIFVKNFKELINDLAAYVKESHTTGLSWNPKVSSVPIDPSAICEPNSSRAAGWQGDRVQG
jgi:hypothetical protein